MSMIDVNDANFESEVTKSDIPVVVDIWAPWCVATDSTIMKDKRKQSMADSINKNDELLAYDGKKIRRSKVSYSRTTSKGGHCKSIATENERTIKVTDDHLFYTSNGWKRACELKIGEKLAVYPTGRKKSINNISDGIIFKEIDLIRVANHYKINNKCTDQIKHFLPLGYSDPKMVAISRLTGALFSDGTLYSNGKNHIHNVEFFLGQKEDIEELASDLKELGFKCNIKKRINSFKIANREIKIKTYRIRVSSAALWLLMRILGVPSGRKTNIKYKLPAWLVNAPNEIKREFLSGYLGGDGPNITIKVVSRGKRGSYNKVNINDIEFYKARDILGSGIEFAKQLACMLKEQGVGIRQIFIDKESYKRKTGGNSKSIHIAISSSFESAYSLASIGYAYSWQKQENANYVKEFLEIRLRDRATWKEKYDAAVTMFRKKIPAKEIALKLNVNKSAIEGWKRGGRPTVNQTYLRYDEWLKEATENLNGGFVWEKISQMGETYLPKVQVITMEKYYNFIANGFLVHNCGPCRLYGPIIEDVAKDFEGKVKFAKINADDNEKTVSSFNVSSIPTTLLIVKGQLKAMNVGAVPKEALKKWINQNL